MTNPGGPPLLGPPPREVRWKRHVVALRSILGILLLGGPFVALQAGESESAALEDLRLRGRRVQGWITGTHSRKGSKGGRNHYVDYVYEAGGQEWSGSYRTARREAERARAGTPLTVTCLPEDPAVHRVGAIDEERVAEPARTGRWGALALALALGGVLAGLELVFRRERALARDGTVAQGIVTGIEPLKAPKGRERFRVSYRFTPPSAAGLDRKVTLSLARAEDLSTGSPITILHDPLDPARHRVLEAFTSVSFD